MLSRKCSFDTNDSVLYTRIVDETDFGTSGTRAQGWRATGGQAFEVAGGSVVGRAHRRTGRGNQDALVWNRAGDVLVAVVTDGCGSGRHSEVGAVAGARMLAAALVRQIEAEAGLESVPLAMSAAKRPSAWAAEAGPGAVNGQGARPPSRDHWPALWARARQDVLGHLRALATSMGDDLAAVIAEHLLFTAVVAVVTPGFTAVFSIGDGVVAINGNVRVMGPFPGNQPPYLAYELLDAGALQPVVVHALCPTDEIDSILLGTDGVVELLAHGTARMPDRSDAGAGLEQFWTEDHYFRNADAVRRSLWLMSRDPVHGDRVQSQRPHAGALLDDDTTIIAIRRKSRRTA